MGWTSEVQDASIKSALSKATKNNKISHKEVLGIIRSTLDGGVITSRELHDLRLILNHSTMLDQVGKRIIQRFLSLLDQLAALNGNPPRSSVRPTTDYDRTVFDFMGRTSKPAFPKLDRFEIGLGLLANARDPGRISQRKSSLCGPADLLFAVADAHPDMYVKFGIDLYEKGSASLKGLKITPGSDLRNSNPKRTNITAVDWVTAASIRDSENWLFDYQAVSDKVAGITFPGEMADWLTKVGFENVTNKAFTDGRNRTRSALLANAQEAAQKFDAGYRVFFLINDSLLKSANQASASSYPNHWVVLTSSMDGLQSLDGPLSFTVFTWGNGRRQVPSKYGSLKVSDFLGHYFGFIACTN